VKKEWKQTASKRERWGGGEENEIRSSVFLLPLRQEMGITYICILLKAIKRDNCNTERMHENRIPEATISKKTEGTSYSKK
jgi:hypothetical protein